MKKTELTESIKELFPNTTAENSTQENDYGDEVTHKIVTFKTNIDTDDKDDNTKMFEDICKKLTGLTLKEVFDKKPGNIEYVIDAYLYVDLDTETNKIELAKLMLEVEEEYPDGIAIDEDITNYLDEIKELVLEVPVKEEPKKSIEEIWKEENEGEYE